MQNPKKERNLKIIIAINEGVSFGNLSKKYKLSKPTIHEIYHRWKDRVAELSNKELTKR